MTAPVSGRFRNNEVKKNISAGGSRRPEIFFAVKIVFQDLILRQIGIEGGPHGHDEKAIAARRAAAYMSPHIRQLPAQNLYSRCQLVLEFIRVALNSPLSQGCLRLEGNSRQHEQLGLFYQSFGGSERRLAHRFLLFLAVVFQSMILLHRHKFPRWSDGVSFFGHRNVETASRLSKSLLVGLLSLPAKKPVDEHFG